MIGITYLQSKIKAQKAGKNSSEEGSHSEVRSQREPWEAAVVPAHSVPSDPAACTGPEHVFNWFRDWQLVVKSKNLGEREGFHQGNYLNVITADGARSY